MKKTGYAMPFTYEVVQHKKDNHEFIQITGFEGEVRDLVIPADIDGKSVEAIGNHAFSGRNDIRTVQIPETVKTLYGFSFHNCRNLYKISLYDSIDDYYDGVCRQCDSLTDIDITIKRDWYEVIRNFLADNDKTLRFTIHRQQETSQLTFPEYVYDFADNTMARTIQFSISGSGYAYRECVDRRKINYREYDKLFEKALIDGNMISEDIAVGRLIYPNELDDSFRTIYEDYARANMKDILERLVQRASQEIDTTGVIRALNQYGKDLVSDEALDHGLKLATEKGLTLVSAALMDKHQDNSSALEFKF